MTITAYEDAKPSRCCPRCGDTHLVSMGHERSPRLWCTACNYIWAAEPYKHHSPSVRNASVDLRLVARAVDGTVS